MPEGPEVESVRRDLLILENKQVNTIYLTDLALKYNRYLEQKENIRILSKTVLKKIERRGKFLLFWFNDNPVLNHLGMTGGWIIDTVGTDLSKYAKVVVEFNDASRAIFDDIRNFGRFQVFKTEQELLEANKALRNLGIDGLKLPFDHEKFKELLSIPRNQNKQIGALLLDQRVVSGIGNIYKSESLFKANINPIRIVETLTNNEINRLGNSISQILQFALSYGGSTIENFQTPFGAEGKAQQWHQVYNRHEKPCFVCQNTIFRMVQNTRSTFFCPECQEIPDGTTLEELKAKQKKRKERSKAKSSKRAKKKSKK